MLIALTLTVLFWMMGLAKAGVIISAREHPFPRFGMGFGHDAMDYLMNELNMMDTSSQIMPQESEYSNAEWSVYNVPEPDNERDYAFGYDNVQDSDGNEQYRSEEKFKNGTTIGEYGFTDIRTDNMVRVKYTADYQGYRSNFQLLPLNELIYQRIENFLNREIP